MKQQNDTSSNDNLEENQNEKPKNKNIQFKKTIRLKRKDNNIEANKADTEDLDNDSQNDNNEDQETNRDEDSRGKGELSFNLPNKHNKNLTLSGNLEEESNNEDALDISPPIKRKKDSQDTTPKSTGDEAPDEKQLPTKIDIQPELIGTLPIETNSINNNQEENYSPEELENLIQQGKKKQALEILGNMALDVIKAEKAIKALNYLKNNGALDNDESDRVHDSARRTIKKCTPTNKITPHNDEIDDSEINNDDTSVDNTPDNTIRKSISKPTIQPNTSEELKEDSSPHQEISKVSSPPHNKSASKKPNENSQQTIKTPKKKFEKSEDKNKTKDVIKNVAKKTILSIFLNPTTYIVLFIIIVIIIIIISIAHIVICIQGFTTNQAGVCNDITSIIGSAMIEKMKQTLNTISNFLNDLLSKISTYVPTDNTDIADNIDQIRNSGLDQEI